MQRCWEECAPKSQRIIEDIKGLKPVLDIIIDHKGCVVPVSCHIFHFTLHFNITCFQDIVFRHGHRGQNVPAPKKLSLRQRIDTNVASMVVHPCIRELIVSEREKMLTKAVEAKKVRMSSIDTDNTFVGAVDGPVTQTELQNSASNMCDHY